MPKCDFNKVASNFIEIAIWHGCSPVNLLRIFRTPFPRNTSGWLLLLFVQLGFNINNKCHYLTYVLTRVSSFTTYERTTNNNEDRKEFQIRKNAKIYSIL